MKSKTSKDLKLSRCGMAKDGKRKSYSWKFVELRTKEEREEK